MTISLAVSWEVIKVAKLVCEVCGYTTEVPGAEAMAASEIPQHCGQPMRIVRED